MKKSIHAKFHPASWWILGCAVAIAAVQSADAYFLAALCLFSIALIYLGAKVLSGGGRTFDSLWFYLALAAAVITARVLFRVLFGFAASNDQTVIDFPLLQINLGFGEPIQFLGPVSASSLSQGFTDGVRLAAIILGIGFATVLANPRRLLKSIPVALFEIATSIAISFNLAPQLIKSIQRVRKARQLRGRSSGIRALAGIIVPVLEDTFQSSLALAASMESRGFGNSSKTNSRLASTTISISSISLMAIGSYLLITRGSQYFYLLVIALVGVLVVLYLGSRSSTRTRLTSSRFTKWDTAPLVIASGLVLFVQISGWLP